MSELIAEKQTESVGWMRHGRESTKYRLLFLELCVCGYVKPGDMLRSV